MKSRILFLLLLTAGFNGVAQFSDPFEIEIDRNGTEVHLHVEILPIIIFMRMPFLWSMKRGIHSSPLSGPPSSN